MIQSYTNPNGLTIRRWDQITKNDKEYLILQIDTFKEELFVHYRTCPEGDDYNNVGLILTSEMYITEINEFFEQFKDCFDTIRRVELTQEELEELKNCRCECCEEYLENYN